MKQRVDLLLRGAEHLLVCDAGASAMQDASIAVADGVIVGVGPANEVAAEFEAAEVIDVSGMLVMPGLVNLHTHLPMTLLRGIAENVDLEGFLRLVWAEEARVMDADGTLIGARLGALEALLGGTTTALDMYFHPEAAHRGAVDLGLRQVIGPVFFDFDGPDHLPWDARMALMAEWPSIHADIGGAATPLALMPHSPQIVSPDHLAELAAVAGDGRYVVHTHCSESVAENAATVAAFGKRPAVLLRESGLLSQRTVLAHGVHLDADDQAMAAAAGAAVAHCPGSNLKLASGAADIVGYRSRGIRVGLGSDGCSSSNDLDMFAVMRQAANLARLVRADPAAISASDIVLAATLEGARALGMQDSIGSIEVGKRADLAVLDLQSPHLVPIRDPYTAVVFAAGRGDVRHVVVDGEVVVADGASTRIDHAEVIADARQRVREHA